MEIGISSACFYPLATEESLEKVGELGFKTCEIFMNSPSELEGRLLNELCAIKDYYGLTVRSIHPFTSAFETSMFFSLYERRFYDAIDFYKRYCHAANKLGAEMIVFHGEKTNHRFIPELYAERYAKLLESAVGEGIFIAHENVNGFNCAKPENMKFVADYAGENFRMVLDIKQCRRAGVSEFDFIKLFGDRIAQVHISDFDSINDCLPPGEGKYDFGKLFDFLRVNGYDKTALIELYSENYKNIRQISDSEKFLLNFC